MSSMGMSTHNSNYQPETGNTSLGLVFPVEETRKKMGHTQQHFKKRKLTLNNPSSVHLDHSQLPYMTVNSSALAGKRKSVVPPNVNDRVKLLPLNIQRGIKKTQEK